jgi:hypothetical protein
LSDAGSGIERSLNPPDEQLERKTQRLEKRNKRLTVALTMTLVNVKIADFWTFWKNEIALEGDF